jgi:hypothetical protein
MKKTQFGWVFIGVVLFVFGFILYKNLELKTTVILSLLSLAVILLFYKLTIYVTVKEVKFSLGIGLINGAYKLSDINQCTPISYFPLGWGVRFRPGVTLFNVSGNKAIELDLKHKKRKVWIGTNKPEEISEYINLIKKKGNL